MAPAVADVNVRVVRTITPEARLLLARYLPDQLAPRDVLPEVLQRWIGRQRAELADSTDVPARREPLTFSNNGRCLSVRLFSERSRSLLLLEESLRVADGTNGFDLTRREAEVVAWVARGKTNKEIAAILDVSPRTVQKHLEHAFEKLGVETRTAAAKVQWMSGALDVK